MKYDIAFGENLKRLIKLKFQTPEDIAAHGNIETKQVYRVINAEHSPSLSSILAIAKGLDVHPMELFDFKFDFE